MSPNDEGTGFQRMANIKSQIKRNRQNEQRRVRNRSGRSFLRTKVKRFEQALEGGDANEARNAYHVVARELDRAASKGIIHRNKAANKKSRLAKRLNASS
jgi:small subunit ribosomal protein S20